MNAETKEQQAALTLPERASVALGSPAHEVKLRELVLASAAILSVTNKDGREECHTAYMALKNTRCSITNKVDEVTEDAKKFTKAVKTEAQRLIDITTAEEDRLQKLRDDYDDAEKARKDALIAAERARIEAIQRDIQSIRDIPASLVLKPSEDIAAAIDALRAQFATEDRFDTFIGAARLAIVETDHALVQMHGAKVGVEIAAAEAESARLAEVARIAAEREELAQLRAAAAESARIQKIETDRVAAEQAAEAKRLADLAATQRAEAERVQAQAAANLAAERAALDEQMSRERERVAADAKRQLEAQQAAIAAERVKANAELAEAQAKLNAEVAAHAAKVAAELDAANIEAAEVAPHPSLFDTIESGDSVRFDESPTDTEIIYLLVQEYSMTVHDAIERLAAIDFVAARVAMLEAT